MSAKLMSLLVLFGGLAAGAVANAQEVVVYSPIEVPVAVSPPAVTYGRVYVRSPVVVARPPVTVYRPVVPAPTVRVYSPVAPAVVPASPVVVTAGRPVVVRSKVYVPGQPIRNVLRAVTP